MEPVFMDMNYKSAAADRLNTFFLFLTSLFLSKRVFEASMFKLSIPEWFQLALVVALCTTAGIKLLFSDPRSPEFRVAPLFILLYGLIYHADGYQILLAMAALTVGFIGIDYRRILKVYVVSVGISLVVVILACLSGAIPDLVYLSDHVLRSAWGICYPTDFASITLFLSLFLWVEWKRLPDWAMLLVNLIPTWAAWYVAASRTSFICCLLFGCMIVYHIITQYFIERHDSLSSVIGRADRMLTGVFPLFAVGMLCLLFLYWHGASFAQKADLILSNRLHLGLNAIQEYGIKAFGTPFRMVGNGGYAFTRENYNFVDSTYYVLPLRYGWVMLAASCFFWGWIILKALRAGDRRLALITAVIALHSVSEHHFVDPHYNILFVMPLAAYPRRESVLSHQHTEKMKWYSFAVFFALVLVWISQIPFLTSNLKTFFQVKGYTSSNGSCAVLIAALCCVLFVMSALYWSVDRLLNSLLQRKKTKKSDRAVFLTALMLGGCILWYGRSVIHTVSLDAPEQNIIALAASSSSGHVYSDILPEMMIHCVDGIDRSAFSGEELGRFSDVTLLTDSANNYDILTRRNFLYFNISDRFALYTNDSSVIDVLESAGYHLTGFHNSWIPVPLNQMNSGDYRSAIDQRSLMLNSSVDSLCTGPDIRLKNGAYSLHAVLKACPEPADSAVAVCTIRICADSGKTILAEQTVNSSSFSIGAPLAVTLPFQVSGASGWMNHIEFLIYGQGGFPLTIEDLRYAQTPKYDLHSIYNDNNKLIRQEYYTLDGKKVINSKGYFAHELEYDSDNNLAVERFYDAANQPVLLPDGFAEVRRVYNNRSQVIRQEYYGTDGKLIELPCGYAVVEREFDAAGEERYTNFYDAQGNLLLHQ